MKFDLKSLLKDKNVLYVTLFIAVSNMFAYLMFRQFDAIIFFVIIGILASYFSKNMIIIMLVALISTNLAISIKMIGKVKEGFKEERKDKKKVDKIPPQNAKEILTGGTIKKKIPKVPKGVKPPGTKAKEGKQGFTQQLNPARINAMSDDEDGEGEDDSSPSVNYASTLESAYDNLDKLLSSDAISKMSEDTNRLAEKQQLLMGNINKLQPMMQKAGSLLEGLNMGDMTSMMTGLQGKLSSLTGGDKKMANKVANKVQN